MDLNEKLERALGLKVVFEAIGEGQLFDRGVWMTTDPQVLSDLAYTSSKRTWWTRLRQLAKENGDADLVRHATEVLKGVATADPEIFKTARSEARRFADERKASAPRGAAIRGRTEKPDPFNPQQKEQPPLTQGRVKREWPGDKLWGIFDQTGHRIRGGYASQEQAAADVAGDPVRFPDPQGVTYKQYENDRSASALMSVRAPLQNGWTKDEIFKAMEPFIRSMAWRYAKTYQDVADMQQQGALGILDALKNDKGEEPFVSYAKQFMNSAMRRYGAKANSTISGAEALGAGGKNKGVNLGYEVVFQKKEKGAPVDSKFFPTDPSAFSDYYSSTGRMPPRSNDPAFKEAKKFEQEMKAQGFNTAFTDKRGRMASASAPMAGGSGESPGTLGDTLKATKVKTPMQIAMNRDQIKQLIDTAGLTDQQKKVIMLSFGLDQPEGGEGGSVWGSPEARVGSKFGPPESGEASKKPGEQGGLPPQELGVDPLKAKQEPGLDWGSGEGGKVLAGEKPKTISLVRGPVEVAQMMTGPEGKPLSTEKVRQHRAKALKKLYDAAAAQAEEEGVTQQMMSKQTAANRAPAKLSRPDLLPTSVPGTDEPGTIFPTKTKAQQDQEKADYDALVASKQARMESLVSCMRLFAGLLCEMIVNGELNDVVLG